MPHVIRSTQARIHLASLRSNVSAVRRAIPTGTIICAAVKANAYGHGAVQISRILREEKIEVLGVSSPLEGLELRDSGDVGRILVLGPTVPDEVEITIKAGLETVVTDESFLKVLESKIVRLAIPRILPVHLKVDTGMGRIGCHPDQALTIAKRISENSSMALAGIATHFPSADSPKDKRFTTQQVNTLKKTAEKIKNAGIDPGILHAANSAGIVLGQESALGMVRPGIMLYGYTKSVQDQLKPVMEFTTRITALKKVHAGQSLSYGRTWTAKQETLIATIPVGYADGYPRLLSNRAEVLIGKQRHPIAGTICMDQTMVDLGNRTDVSLYDDVVLFGPDPKGPDANELADLAGTIPYEISCGITSRVPRVYKDSD